MQSWEIKQICHDEGYQEGRDEVIADIVRTKKARGMSPEEIAEWLEKDIDLITRLYHAAD